MEKGGSSLRSIEKPRKLKAPLGLSEPYHCISWLLAYNSVCLANVLLASSQASMELHSHCRVNLKLKPLPQNLDGSINCTEVRAAPPRCPSVHLGQWDMISGASEHNGEVRPRESHRKCLKHTPDGLPCPLPLSH